MVDITGRLSLPELEIIAEAINSKAVDRSDPCPNCGKTPSEILPYLSRVELGVEERGSRGLSVVVTVCTQCAFVRQFSTQALGVEGHPGGQPLVWTNEEAASG